MSFSKKFLIISVLICLTFTTYGQNNRFMTRLEIYPKNVTMVGGDVVRFTALAVSHNGTAHTPRNIRWHAQGNCGVISQDGTFRAGQRRGTFRISASYGGQKSLSLVTIKTLNPVPASIARIQVTPSYSTLNVGQNQRFVAKAYDMYNQQVSFTPEWGIRGGRSSIGYNGVFNAQTPGTYTITARAKGTQHVGSATVVVRGFVPNPNPNPSPVNSMRIFPGNAQVKRGETCYFKVTAYNAYGQPISCNPQWYANGGTINQAGRFQAGHQKGTFRVWVKDRYSGITASASVRITGHGGGNHGNGRIVVTNWDVGGGNWLTPRAKISVQVFGNNIQTVKLYSVSPDGYYTELQARSCSNGQKVHFDCKYMVGASFLEIRLYSPRGKVLAKEKRRPNK